ncbi:MAG: glutathione S-transferase family protein [Aquincola sp.]|nr:glutathione S-transferase family protein [Aquincola sp.]MDH5330221.1 glutathione S-transferase family protein [Aquincola sp.]
MAAAKPYTLYGSRNSGSAAVEAALEMARAPYRIVSAATWDKKSALAELKRVNPLHQIPTLVMPDGTVLTESAAILIHLGLAHPRAKLLPADTSQRARAIRAMVFIAANCYAAIGVIDYPERWNGKGDAAANERLRRGARRRLHKLWTVFADSIATGKGPFLFGEQPGAADILAAVVSRWSGARKHLARHRPKLHALLERVDAHPPVAAVISRHWGAGPVST